MKKLIAGFIAGAVLASVGIAAAASGRLLMLRSGDTAIFPRAGSGCHADALTATKAALLCFRVDAHGYGVIYSPYFVEVLAPGKHGKVVFHRDQPLK